MDAYCQSSDRGVLLKIKLQPRSSRNEIGTPTGGWLKVFVTAPPVDSAANEALIRLLADRLDVPKGAISLVRGRASRQKLIFISGILPSDVEHCCGSG